MKKFIGVLALVLAIFLAAPVFAGNAEKILGVWDCENRWDRGNYQPWIEDAGARSFGRNGIMVTNYPQRNKINYEVDGKMVSFSGYNPWVIKKLTDDTLEYEVVGSPVRVTTSCTKR